MNIPEQFLIKDPTKLVKGQKLWSAQFGEVEFKEYEQGQILIKARNGNTFLYTGKGMIHYSDLLPTLLLLSPFESQERVILVRATEKEKWVKRVLIKFIGDKPVCWDMEETIEGAKLEVDTCKWNFWKELEEPKEEKKEEMISIKELKQMSGTQLLELLNK
jgi:hypothetical protein